ncbi:MAG TPA: SOS response-associated peptidase [Trebonia sp.]|nr:SOS response-associated peptidase [Trebonia sp.]
MCGRFVSARKRLELLEEFAVERDRVGEDRAPDYNVAPTKRIYAVLEHTERADAEKTEDKPVRELRLLKWGLVPSWAKESSGGARLINARAETVAVKPSFRSAFARRRCLIPADGYYEWQVATDEAAGKKIKQPFFIYPRDGGILSFAGIYELWRDGSVPPEDEDAWLWTASIITTDAPDEIGKIHDRTPLMIARESWEDWLDPANKDKELLMAMMLPATSSAASGLTSRAVSTAVNSVRNNGPDLIEPLPPGAPPGKPHDKGSRAHGSGSGPQDGPSLF